MSDIKLSGLGDLLNLRGKIAKAIVGVPKEVRATNQRWAGILKEKLIQHSSGRPGPRIVTNAYNAAYVTKVEEDGMMVTADNSSPQSDRLENGYVGTDALGRHYHQPAFPHFRPTLEEAAPEYAKDISEALPRWWT